MIYRNFLLLVLTICAFNSAVSYPEGIKNTNASNTQTTVKGTSDNERPNAKLTTFGVIDQPDSQIYRKAAVENGMDPDAVAEVVRTGKPFVHVENDENGARKTTTYSLQPDGSISRHVRTEYRPSFSSTSKVFLPANTMSAPLPNKSSENNSTSKKESDWEWNPSNVPRFGVSSSSTDDFPSWTPNWQIPTFTYDRRPHIQQVPAVETTPSQLPEMPHWRNLGIPIQTDTFNGIDSKDAGTVTKTIVDGDNRKITTVHTVGPTEWRTKTITLPWTEFNSRTTTTTTRRPQIAQTDFRNAAPTLPSLEDFLKSQYATTIKSPTESKHPLPQSPVSESWSKPVTTVNINDLPIVEILNTGDPYTPIPDYKSQTKTYTRTIQTNGVPQISDLDPHMKDILEKAGINPNDVLASKDGTVTKTRHEPDGKVVTTTYRIRTVPSTVSTDSSHFADSDNPQGPFLIKNQPNHSESHSGTLFPTVNSLNIPHRADNSAFNKNFHPAYASPEPGTHPEITPNINKNPIDEFLAKLNLTAAGIKASNGEVIKTLVDENGRVLTASFVLSTVRNNNSTKDKTEKAPIK